MAKRDTMNPKFDTVGSGRRKCWGCNMKDISQWCPYRWWPEERRPGYRFRMFRKIHLLPTCRRDNFAYTERNIFVKRYCDAMGIDSTSLMRTPGRRGGGGRGGRVAAKPLMI